MSEKLNPCPFCGSTHLVINGRGRYVYCEMCNATGPEIGGDQSAAESIRLWNTRKDASHE